jgi:hypothetical protein
MLVLLLVQAVLACVNNLLGDNIDTINKNRNFNHSSKEVGLERNTQKSKYIVLSLHQNANQNRDM